MRTGRRFNIVLAWTVIGLTIVGYGYALAAAHALDAFIRWVR